MSESWPTRVVLRDKNGKVLSWFNPNDALAWWEPDAFENCARPLDVYIWPIISLMASGQWILWNSSIVESTASRKAEVLTAHEAVKHILEWGLDPGAHASDIVESLKVGCSQLEKPRMVLEIESNSFMRFDPSGCKKWGPKKSESGWDSTEDCPVTIDVETLYRFPGGQFVVISEEIYYLVDRSSGESLSRFTDEQAANWLLANDFEIPSDLQQHIADRIFDPTKTIIQRAPIEPLDDLQSFRGHNELRETTEYAIPDQIQHVFKIEPSEAKQKGVKAAKLEEAFAYIRAKGPVCGAAIASHLSINETTFRKHYVPDLKKRGVVNEGPGGHGYCLSEGAT